MTSEAARPAPLDGVRVLDFTDMLGHAEGIEDTRFALSRAREAHWSELMRLIEQWTETRSGQACEDGLGAAGVPCTRYRTVQDHAAVMLLPPRTAPSPERPGPQDDI